MAFLLQLSGVTRPLDGLRAWPIQGSGYARLVRVMIHPFASKKVECRNNHQNSTRLCGKPGVHDKRHDTIYSDYLQVLNCARWDLATESQVIALVSDYLRVLKHTIGFTR